MSEFNRSEFLIALMRAVVTLDYATNSAAVEALFEPLFKLPAAEQVAIGKSLEESGASFEFLRRIALKEGLAGAEKYIKDHANSLRRFAEPMPLAPFDPWDIFDFAETQAHVPTTRNVEKLLGAKASPLTKAFNRAAAKLTPEEIWSPAVYIKPNLAVLKVIAKQEGLKKSGGPKQ
jgi:hypothetical protein